MRILKVVFSLCFFFSLQAWAQFTTVTGTVIDPNGIPYANGTITPTLVTSATPTLSGLAYIPPIQAVGLNLSGSFSMRLADNTALSPGGTKWNFQVCSAGGTIQPAAGNGPVCFSLAAPITISGSSQDISSNLNAVSVALSLGGSTPSGSVVNNTPLPTPAVPTITQGGTPGITTVSYEVVAINAVGQSLQSPLATTTTSAASLTGVNFNNVQTAAVTGSTSCWVYRTTTAQIPHTTGWIGSVACGGTLADTGLAVDGPVTGNGTLPFNLNTSTGLAVKGNLTAGSFGGSGTTPTTPMLVYNRLAVGANALTPVPPNAQFYIPGTPTPGILLADGPGTIGNSLYLWAATPGGLFAPQIVQLMSGGTLSAPDNNWGGGGIGDINTCGFVGGAVNDWRCYTIIEYGSADSGNPTTDTPHGKIQLGVNNGTAGGSPSQRPGFNVLCDPTNCRTTNTNNLPFYVYNVGLPFVFNGESANFERAELRWTANVFNLGPTAGGSGTLRSMNLTGATISINSATNALFRCTVAGTLRVGELTTVSGDCGTAVDTGLRIP